MDIEIEEREIERERERERQWDREEGWGSYLLSELSTLQRPLNQEIFDENAPNLTSPSTQIIKHTL